MLFSATMSILTGITLLAFTHQLFNNIINSQVVIKEGTASYAAWKETPIPVYTKFYFFDMLNPQELFHRHEMPILEERGPYTFREVERKVNISWHPENGTVSYKRMKHWYFEPSMSIGPLNDTITTINVPVVGSAEFVRGDFFMEWGMSDMLSTIQATIFVRRTIAELLFDGYDDVVMDIGSSFNKKEDEDEYGNEDMYGFGEDEDDDDNFGFGDDDSDGFGFDDEEYDGFGFADEEYSDESGESKEEEKEQNGKESEKVPMDKFGWFYKRNGTSWSDGDLLMETGTTDVNRLGRIVSWNGQRKTDAYEGICGEVRGSADGLFPPGMSKTSDIIAIFSTDLCRSLRFKKKEELDHLGIPAIKYQLEEESFANGTVCPENTCFGNNLRTGVQNVTQCKVKSPAFVSRPHFHLADPFYAEQFQFGVHPDPNLHESSFWLEPQSSIPIKVEMRLQLNILLQSVPGMEYLFKDLQQVMFPVMWFDSVAAVPEEMAGSLRLLISLPVMFRVSGGLSLLVGSLLLLLLCWQKLKEHRDDRKPSPLSTGGISPGYKVVPREEGQKL